MSAQGRPDHIDGPTAALVVLTAKRRAIFAVGLPHGDERAMADEAERCLYVAASAASHAARMDRRAIPAAWRELDAFILWHGSQDRKSTLTSGCWLFSDPFRKWALDVPPGPYPEPPESDPDEDRAIQAILACDPASVGLAGPSADVSVQTSLTYAGEMTGPSFLLMRDGHPSLHAQISPAASRAILAIGTVNWVRCKLAYGRTLGREPLEWTSAAMRGAESATLRAAQEKALRTDPLGQISPASRLLMSYSLGDAAFEIEDEAIGTWTR